MDKRTLRALAKGLVLILSLAGAMYGLKAMGVEDALNEHWVDTYLSGQGLKGQFLFLAMATAITAVGLPRQIVSFLAGYAYGFLYGTLLATLGTAFGCVVTFYYARLLGRGFVARRWGRRIAKVNNVLKDDTFSMTLVIRFLPVGSNLLTSLLAGVSQAPAGWYLLGSAIGFIPQTAIFALLGSGVNVDPVWRTALAVVLFLASGAMGYALYRKYKLERALNGDD